MVRLSAEEIAGDVVGPCGGRAAPLTTRHNVYCAPTTWNLQRRCTLSFSFCCTSQHPPRPSGTERRSRVPDLHPPRRCAGGYGPAAPLGTLPHRLVEGNHATPSFCWRPAYRPQQCLNFRPEPQGHGSFLPTLSAARRTVFPGSGSPPTEALSVRRIKRRSVQPSSMFERSLRDSLNGICNVIVSDRDSRCSRRFWAIHSR